MSDFELDRVHRQLIMPEIGLKGQDRLSSAKVLVIGIGGLGCPAALYLAAAGVGTLGIVDSDVVNISNLNRQILHGMKDISKPKVISAMESLNEINPSIQVNPLNILVDKNNILDLIEEYDVVIDAVDNFASRFLVNDACFFSEKPLVEAGVKGWEGQITTIIPNKGPCLRCIIEEPSSTVEVIDSPQKSIIGVVSGIIGIIQGLEAIKLILGVGDTLSGRILAFNGLKGRFQEVQTIKRKECPLCGVSPRITRMSDLEL